MAKAKAKVRAKHLAHQVRTNLWVTRKPKPKPFALLLSTDPTTDGWVVGAMGTWNEIKSQRGRQRGGGRRLVGWKWRGLCQGELRKENDFTGPDKKDVGRSWWAIPNRPPTTSGNLDSVNSFRFPSEIRWPGKMRLWHIDGNRKAIK